MIYLGDWQLLCCKDKRPSVLFIYHGISDPDKLTVANSTLCLTEILLHGLKKNKNIYMRTKYSRSFIMIILFYKPFFIVFLL